LRCVRQRDSILKLKQVPSVTQCAAPGVRIQESEFRIIVSASRMDIIFLFFIISPTPFRLEVGVLPKGKSELGFPLICYDYVTKPLRFLTSTFFIGKIPLIFLSGEFSCTVFFISRILCNLLLSDHTGRLIKSSSGVSADIALHRQGEYSVYLLRNDATFRSFFLFYL
jgi:hypothetical protein